MSAPGRTRQLSIQPGMDPTMLRLISEQRSINRDFDRRKPVTAPTIFASDSVRPLASKNPRRIIFVRQADGSLRGQYSDGTNWQTFLATAVSFATPSITYGTTYASGTAATTIRSDATLKYPTALMSSANSFTLTASDDAVDLTLAGSNGALNLRSGSGSMTLDLWTGASQSAATVGKVLGFLARTVNVGTTLTHGIHSQVTYDTAATYTGITHRSGEFQLNQTNTSPTYSSETAQVLRLQFSSTSFGSATHSWTEIGDISALITVPTGANTTITDVYGFRLSGWPTIGTGGTITNGYGSRWQFPTVGATVRRGVWVDPSSTANLGTEATNTEGFYCGALPRGTTQRASFSAAGHTTGTPTRAICFDAAAHSVGTDQWSFRGAQKFENTGTDFIASASSKGIVGQYSDQAGRYFRLRALYNGGAPSLTIDDVGTSLPTS